MQDLFKKKSKVETNILTSSPQTVFCQNQAKEASNIYLHDPRCNDNTVEDKDIKEAFFSIPSIKSPSQDGFSNGFYKLTWSAINPLDLNNTAGLKANLQKSQMVLGGCNQSLQRECLQATGLTESTFPLKYLGVPITASRLTKIECRSLVNKITSRVHTWSIRNISFAGRARLINSVVFERPKSKVGIHTNRRGQPTDAEIGEEMKRGENTEEHYKCHNHNNNLQHMQAINSKISTSQNISRIQTVQHIKDQV
ncbi:hypothetical protein Cgig2_027983 [Carnegiea gigantea]|uniref:Uncharacterized protein n=1 Tax=Carnegiea gigantea TaxID=171969 RepID=A0A9Q1JGM4_9CARY|nr:hypothetical protein Cgig2_027983 [Carnegiea gigantea]